MLQSVALPTTDPAQITRLNALLGVTRLVRQRVPRAALVRAVAKAISDGLGFQTVVVNVHRPATNDFVAAEVYGSASARAALLGATSDWSFWRSVLDSRFEVAGAQFVPAGSIDWDAIDGTSWVPGGLTDRPSVDDGTSWSGEDALFVALLGAGGETLGIVSVDEPVSGLRPTTEELAVLVAIAGHLGSALELADASAAAATRGAALERLARTSITALETLDLEHALASACTAVVEALGYRSVEVAVFDEEHLVVRGRSGTDRRLPGLSRAHVEGVLGDAEVLEACHSLPTTALKPVDGLLCRLERPDGALVGVLLAADPDESPIGQVERRRLLRTFANQIEATLASAAHAAVRDSEARKSAILEASPDAIVTIDAVGLLVELNPAAEAMLGTEALGRALANFIEPRLPEGPLGLATDERVEVTGLRADGTRFSCELAVVPVKRDGPPLYTGYLRDISPRVAAREALERERDQARYAALHDGLTGLPNRTAALEHLAQRLPPLAATGSAVVAISAGLVGLRLITDSLGHAAGSRLLKNAAQRLTARCNEMGALLAQPGSAEFLVLAELDTPSIDAAGRLAEQVSVELEPPYALDGVEVHVAASVGYALLGDLRADPENLLRQADVARHRGETNRLPVTGYDRRLDDSAARLRTLGALRGALSRNELELHYQPIWTIHGRRLSGLEALLRWRRDGVLVTPGDFIAIAETSGLMAPIGEWVIQEACRQAAEWSRAGLAVPVVGVNVSPHQLPGSDVAAVVADALSRYRVAPSSFCVEVTESAIETAPSDLIDTLHSLRDLGVLCALDDFGVEHSSLTRLATLPVDMVKFDRSFLASVPDNPRSVALLRAIVGVSEALELRTVAEGIEHDEQMTVLEDSGVEFAQGFLLARPETPADIAKRLTPDTGERSSGSPRSSAVPGTGSSAPSSASKRVLLD